MSHHINDDIGHATGESGDTINPDQHIAELERINAVLRAEVEQLRQEQRAEWEKRRQLEREIYILRQERYEVGMMLCCVNDIEENPVKDLVRGHLQMLAGYHTENAALRKRCEALEAAARSMARTHHDTCSAELIKGYACDCGKADLDAAISAQPHAQGNGGKD